MPYTQCRVAACAACSAFWWLSACCCQADNTLPCWHGGGGVLSSCKNSGSHQHTEKGKLAKRAFCT